MHHNLQSGYGLRSREAFYRLADVRHQSLSSQPIERVINDKRKFELKGDSVAYKIHETCCPEDDINLLSNS